MLVIFSSFSLRIATRSAPRCFPQRTSIPLRFISVALRATYICANTLICKRACISVFVQMCVAL
nr:MAG TPA: hypothetical protein [Inoviridae sp.]